MVTVKSLEELLRHPRKHEITKIDLSLDNVGTAGAEALAGALSSVGGLQVLDFDGNSADAASTRLLKGCTSDAGRTAARQAHAARIATREAAHPEVAVSPSELYRQSQATVSTLQARVQALEESGRQASSNIDSLQQQLSAAQEAWALESSRREECEQRASALQAEVDALRSVASGVHGAIAQAMQAHPDVAEEVRFGQTTAALAAVMDGGSPVDLLEKCRSLIQSMSDGNDAEADTAHAQEEVLRLQEQIADAASRCQACVSDWPSSVDADVHAALERLLSSDASLEDVTQGIHPAIVDFTLGKVWEDIQAEREARAALSAATPRLAMARILLADDGGRPADPAMQVSSMLLACASVVHEDSKTGIEAE